MSYRNTYRETSTGLSAIEQWTTKIGKLKGEVTLAQIQKVGNEIKEASGGKNYSIELIDGILKNVKAWSKSKNPDLQAIVTDKKTLIAVGKAFNEAAQASFNSPRSVESLVGGFGGRLTTVLAGNHGAKFQRHVADIGKEGKAYANRAEAFAGSQELLRDMA